MAGADRLFLMRPPAIADVERFMFPAIDAARSLGLRQIVSLSLQGVQGNRKTPHYAVERYLRRIEAPYTFLRPNFFMQNLSTVHAPHIRSPLSDVATRPTGNGKPFSNDSLPSDLKRPSSCSRPFPDLLGHFRLLKRRILCESGKVLLPMIWICRL